MDIQNKTATDPVIYMCMTTRYKNKKRHTSNHISVYESHTHLDFYANTYMWNPRNLMDFDYETPPPPCDALFFRGTTLSQLFLQVVVEHYLH